MDWVAPYIGIPFRAKGRTRAGLDCWGLARLVLAEQFDRHLPGYDDWYDTTTPTARQGVMMTDELATSWLPVPQGQEMPGDVVLLRVLGVPMHIGVVIGDGLFLHAQEGTDSCIEGYDSNIWRRRVLGFWRAP